MLQYRVAPRAEHIGFFCLLTSALEPARLSFVQCVTRVAYGARPRIDLRWELQYTKQNYCRST